MTTFKETLEDILKQKEQKEEHPILEKLKTIPDMSRMVNPPNPDEKQSVQTEKEKINYIDSSSCSCNYSETDEFLQLFIDAIPLDENYINLIDFLFPVFEMIEKSNNVEHWRMLEFGKDCDELVRHLEKYIEQNNPTGIVYLDSATKEGRACKETLRKHAMKVVQGIK